LILKTTDIRADVRTLRDKGVNFVGRSAIILGGGVVTFEDSGGNYLKLMQTLK